MWAERLKAFLRPSVSRTVLAMLITAFALTQGVAWCDTMVHPRGTFPVGPYVWFEPHLWPFMLLLKPLYIRLATWDDIQIRDIWFDWYWRCVWETPGPLSPTALMVVVPIHIPYWYVLSCLIVTISKGVWMLLKAVGTRIARKVKTLKR